MIKSITLNKHNNIMFIKKSVEHAWNKQTNKIRTESFNK